MTKKELRQIEDMKKQKRLLRQRFVDAYTNFYGDLEALRRVNKINGIETTDEMEMAILNRYDVLTENGFRKSYNRDDDYELSFRDFFHCMMKTNKYIYKNWTISSFEMLQNGLTDDDLWLDDVWPNSNSYFANLFYLAKKFGFSRIVFTDNSTAAMGIFTTILEMGGKVVGTNRQDKKGGVVIDIESIDPVFEVAKEWETEKNKILQNSCRMETKQELLDEIGQKYRRIYDSVKSV